MTETLTELAKRLKRAEECKTGPWESTSAFHNQANPEYVKFFRETMMTALERGAKKIRYYAEKRQQDPAYLNSIKQRF